MIPDSRIDRAGMRLITAATPYSSLRAGSTIERPVPAVNRGSTSIPVIAEAPPSREARGEVNLRPRELRLLGPHRAFGTLPTFGSSEPAPYLFSYDGRHPSLIQENCADPGADVTPSNARCSFLCCPAAFVRHVLLSSHNDFLGDAR